MLGPLWKLLLVLATVLGAFGGFPEPPKIFKTLTEYEIVQWALVAVLAYQGGAGENIFLSGLVTAVIYILYKGVRMFESQEYIVIE